MRIRNIAQETETSIDVKNKIIDGAPLEHYKLKTIKPKRFICHISDKINRDSITRYGLKTHACDDFTNVLFAYNTLNPAHYYPMDEMYYHKLAYPVQMCHNLNEFDDFILTSANEEHYFNQFDFWRIDTSIISNTWFGFYYQDAIYTFREVPAHAITHCYYKKRKFVVHQHANNTVTCFYKGGYITPVKNG